MCCAFAIVHDTQLYSRQLLSFHGLSSMYHRARAYTCKRQWDKARQDYAFVLRYIPDDPEATQGLADMSQIVEPYPMNIPDR